MAAVVVVVDMQSVVVLALVMAMVMAIVMLASVVLIVVGASGWRAGRGRRSARDEKRQV